MRSIKKMSHTLQPRQLANQPRQGDVLLNKITSVIDLSGATLIKPENGRLILARGEATGHHHSVDCAVAQLFSIDGKTVLVAGEDTAIVHQEHDQVSVEKGMYWVVAQQEYTPQAIRRVAD